MNADYKEMGANAHYFAETYFDSKVLLEKVLDRKKVLLNSNKMASQQMQI